MAATPPDIPRVLVVSNYLADRQFSMLGFTKWLQNTLPTEGFELKAIAPKVRFGGKPAGFSKWLAYVDKFVLFPPALRKAARWADLVHIADQGNAMYGRHAGSTWGITVHDLTQYKAVKRELDWQMSGTGAALQQWIHRWLKQARWVGCASQTTRNDFLRLVNPDPSVSFLTPNGLYREFSRYPDERAKRLLKDAGRDILVDGPFLLSLGGAGWQKNRPGFMRIAAELRNGAFGQALFVIAGHALTEAESSLVRELKLGDALVHIDRPSDEMVTALYSTAQALIFPSTAEGFGLPILEAMACGCPVFSSNRPPMTEVGGDAAIYFDPLDAKAAAATVTEHWGERKTMIEAGFAQADRFSSAASATAYRNWYRTILRGGRN